MTSYPSRVPSRSALLQMVETCWRARWWIIGFALIGALGGLAVTLQSKRIYRAEAVVMPMSSRQRLPLEAVAGDLGDLASIVGLNGQGDPASRLAVATLRGRNFTAKFLHDMDLLPVLFPDKWDKRGKRWIGPPPSDLKAVRLFDRGGIRKIIEDRRTGFVTIQIDWTDRFQAVAWLNAMIAKVNTQLRDQAIAESERSIRFLTAEADKTPSVGVKEAIYRLIETQMKQLTFAEAQDEYALKFVDRPVTPGPLDYIWPRRMVILGIGVLFGGLLGLVACLTVQRLRYILKRDTLARP